MVAHGPNAIREPSLYHICDAIKQNESELEKNKNSSVYVHCMHKL